MSTKYTYEEKNLDIFQFQDSFIIQIKK
jgi:hypothetical protein